MSKLLELAERCEKAEGPDRELDAEILDVLQNQSWDWWEELDPKWWARGAFTPTASLDAAMTLVPEGWRTAMVSEPETDGKWHWRLGPKVDHRLYGRGGRDGFAITSPLALCAAALKARATQEQPE
jgi:hypothetical protein